MVEKLSVEVALEGGDQVQRELTQLEQSFANAGLAVRNFATSFASITAAAGVVAITAAAGALIKFTGVVEETEKALTQLQKVSGASFQSLSALQQVFSQGGTELKKFASEFGNLAEQVAGQTAAIRKASKSYVEWANDIDNVKRQFDNLAIGSGQLFSPLTTLATKVEAVKESLASGGLSAEQQWLKLADIFKNLSSNLERIQLGKALGLSPETIATLSQGSEALRQAQVEAERLGLTLTTANQQALQQMAAGWNQFTTVLSAAFQKIAAAAAPAFAQLLAIANQAFSQIVSDFQSMPLSEALENIGSRLAPAFQAIWEIISPLVTQIGGALGSALAEAFLAALNAALTGAATALFKAIFDDLLREIENFKRFFGLSGGGGGSRAAGAQAFASGGMVGGRGTGTSDSNLAWVSRGEHIMPAAAVAAPGVLAFLEALRRSGGNLRGALDGMGRFARGGLVPQPRMAFAGGGLVRSSNNVTIQFPGVPPVGGLHASSAVIDELRKSAALAQVRSGGRKPSRYS